MRADTHDSARALVLMARIVAQVLRSSTATDRDRIAAADSLTFAADELRSDLTLEETHNGR